MGQYLSHYLPEYLSLSYYFNNKEEEEEKEKGKEEEEEEEEEEELEEIEEMARSPILAEKLLERDEEAMKRLCRALRGRRFAVIRMKEEEEESVIRTRHLVQQFFDQPIQYKLQYELPPSPDPLVGRRRNRGYIPQSHKEYLKIRLLDRDNDLFPDFPGDLKDSFNQSMKRLSAICFSALVALSSANFAKVPPSQSVISEDELNKVIPPSDLDQTRWLDLSSLSLCSQWITEGSSLSVINYLPHGSVFDTDKHESFYNDKNYNNNNNNVDNNNDNYNKKIIISKESINKRREEEERKGEGGEKEGEEKEKEGEGDEKRNVCGAHYDTGVLTFIRVSEVAGLEIFDERGREWIKMEEIGRPGDMVLIMGRKIELLSHKRARLHPTFHRVLLPPNVQRHSILYFCDLPSGKDD